MEFFGDMIKLFQEIINIIENVLGTLESTTEMIDSIDFNDTQFDKYLGYVKYSTGSALWTLLWTLCAIPVGVYLYHTLLYGITLIKDLIR